MPFFNTKSFYQALDKLSEAEKLLDDAKVTNKFSEAELREKIVSLENFKGFIYLSLQEYEKAKLAFEKALDINPNSSQACAGLGEVFYLGKMDQEAKIMYEWAIDNNPQNQFAVSGLEKVNKSLGLPPENNTLNIETTLNKKTKYFKYISEAYSLFSEKKYNEALEKLDEVEKLFSKTLLSNDSTSKIASVNNFRGFNYLALDELEKAKEAFETALKLNQYSSQACAGLGEVYFLGGLDKDAKTMFEWAVKNNPNNGFAVRGLSKINKQLGFTDTHNSLFSA